MHLARTWRSSDFQSIKGQDLVVRILQNNLYRGYFFPLYLFAGPRGSGKTSTARIFAAAANCHNIDTFRSAPREQPVPCRECSSCRALFSGSHPDVIEIDAASYTGVDNVRSIIDSATFLPVMSSNKIYIIDEAHMLSKAAFNAFLKILEEPPQAALFILATTDPSKILTTVTSRSLQLYFQHVDEQVVREHLTHVCEHEDIPYESSGLVRLSQAAGGSIRDALQTLERVYLAHERVSRDAVISTLGEVDEEMMIRLFSVLAQQDMYTSMQYVHDMHLEQYAPMRVWSRIVDMIRALFWGHFGRGDPVWEHVDGFFDLVHMYQISTLRQLLQLAYTYEQYIVKTTCARSLFEMLLFECKRIIDGTAMPPDNTASGSDTPRIDSKQHNTSVSQEDGASSSSEAQSEQTSSSETTDAWERVVAAFENESDPLIASVLKQAYACVWDDAQTLRVVLARELQFYYEWLCNHTDALHTIVHRVYGVSANVTFSFADVSLASRGTTYRNTTSQHNNVSQQSNQAHTEQAEPASHGAKKNMKAPRTSRSRVTYETITDINDANKWPFAHAVMRAFPGSVKRLKKRE